MGENLMDSLLKELRRNRELLIKYECIPQGAFGAVMIRKDITDGEQAIAESDTVKMLEVFAILRDNQ